MRKILFVGADCPHCESVKEKCDLSDVEVQDVGQMGEYPQDDDEVEAQAEADFFDVWSVPQLLIVQEDDTVKERVTDLFEMREILGEK